MNFYPTNWYTLLVAFSQILNLVDVPRYILVALHTSSRVRNIRVVRDLNTRMAELAIDLQFTRMDFVGKVDRLVRGISLIFRVGRVYVNETATQ